MARKCQEQGDTSGYRLTTCKAQAQAHFRYFGRAKDLPGVKELFNKGGELILVLRMTFS